MGERVLESHPVEPSTSTVDLSKVHIGYLKRSDFVESESAPRGTLRVGSQVEDGASTTSKDKTSPLAENFKDAAN